MRKEEYSLIEALRAAKTPEERERVIQEALSGPEIVREDPDATDDEVE